MKTVSEQRRQLRFNSFDQVHLDLDTLVSGEYLQTGQWDLSQTCAHLNDWMTYPIDGYPRMALPFRGILWSMKVSIGKKQLALILDNGFRDSTPTMPQTVYRPGTLSDQEAVLKLKTTIDRFDSSDGLIHPSPVFGPMTRDVAVRLQ